jgi:hypothetical protein
MRLIRRSILSFIDWFGRVGVPPMMRWLADVDPQFAQALAGRRTMQTVHQPYTSSEGSPISIWLYQEAQRRSSESPTMQRDLNAALELMRVDSVSGPMFRMYTSLMIEGYPIQEVFYRVMANVLLVGYTAGLMQADAAGQVAAGGFEQGERNSLAPAVDAEFVDDPGDAGDICPKCLQVYNVAVCQDCGIELRRATTAELEAYEKGV